jgi:hypothetical protein
MDARCLASSARDDAGLFTKAARHAVKTAAVTVVAPADAPLKYEEELSDVAFEWCAVRVFSTSSSRLRLCMAVTLEAIEILTAVNRHLL